jgi:hypothetical protein
MLCDWDGLSAWEHDADWKGRDSLFSEDIDESRLPTVRGRIIEADTDYSYNGANFFLLITRWTHCNFWIS